MNQIPAIFDGGNKFLTTDTYTLDDVNEACEGIPMDDPANAIISVFYRTVNPDVKFGSPFVRKAADKLVKAFGPTGAFNLAKFAVAFRYREYFPRVSTPQELAAKMANVASAVFDMYRSGEKKNNVTKL